MNSMFIKAVDASTPEVSQIEGPRVSVDLTLDGKLVATAIFGSRWGFEWISGPDFTVTGCDTKVKNAIYNKALPVYERKSLNDFSPAILNHVIENATPEVIVRDYLTDVVFSHSGYEICTVVYNVGQNPVVRWSFNTDLLKHISSDVRKCITDTARLALAINNF